MISYSVTQSQIDTIEKQLTGLNKSSSAIMKKAVNDTAKEARKKLAKHAKSRYVIKNDKVNFQRSMKIKNATLGNRVAVISSKGTSTELLDHKVNPNMYLTGKNRPSVLSAKVLKSSSMAKLVDPSTHVKAFIAKFESGHVAVVQRVPGKVYKSSKGLAKRVNQGMDTTMIKKLLSPSVPKMLGLGGEGSMYSFMETEVKADLEKNLVKYINQALEG